MLTSVATRRPLGLVAVAALGLVAQAGAQESRVDYQRRVPDAVVKAAGRPGSPDSFARALAHLAIPAVVITGALPPVGGPVAFDPSEPSGGFSLIVAMNRFRESHPNYAVNDAEGTVVLTPLRSKCLAPMDRLVDLKSRGKVHEVLFALARVLDPSLPDVPPAIVSGGGSRGSPDLLHRLITIDSAGKSVLATLAALARRSPGVVWGVREESALQEREGRCVLILLAADSVLTTSYEVR